jgi:hypothetical protein
VSRQELIIQAAYDPGTLRAGFTLDSGLAVTLEAADGDAPRLSMLAYTGAPMRFAQIPHPVVVDLAGVTSETPEIPLLRGHNHAEPVGHGSIRVDAAGIHVDGVLSGAGTPREDVLASAKRGFPWQASIGARVVEAELVKAGKRVTVNGRTFDGPIVVARKTVVYEVSFVALGADRGTTTRIAASTEGNPMKFEDWLKKLGLEASKLTDEMKASLEQAWKIEKGELRIVAARSGREGHEDPDRDDLAEEAGKIIGEVRAQYAAEQKRISAVRELCGEANADIAAEAIEKGWTPERTELQLLRASRPTVDLAARRGTAGQPVNTTVLEAACMISLGYDDEATLKAYGEQTMNQADRFRGIGLRDLALMSARNDGADVPSVFGDGRSVIEAATSTRSLSSVASNVVGKIALRIYEAHEIVGFQIARTRNVPDFKQVEAYRLTGTGQWEEVGKDGTLKSGTLDDDRYTNQATLHGQVLGIDYKDFVNDDLGILNDIGTLLGHSGASLIDHKLFTLILANTGSFFHSDNANLLTGAGSAFGLTGLANARKAFRKLKAGPGAKAKDDRPIQVNPKILLVPPELETDAEALLNSAGVNLTGSTAAEKADGNPWRNKYQLVVAPHLSDASYSGYSAAAWYLLADPSMVAALELAFVGGVRTPTVRRVPAPYNSLGLFYQGYLAVGAAFVDPKGAQKSAGS